jgi:hypothetical protein
LEEHISHLIVENDSNILIDMIMDNYKFSGMVPGLVWRICSMCWLWIGISKFVTLEEKETVVPIGLPSLAFLLIL